MIRSISLIALTLSASTLVARADVSAAARAFADGQAAQLDGNHERAAQSFELAYNITPSKEALRSAVRARQANNQLPRAATLAYELVTRFSDDAASVKLGNDVLAEAKVRLGKISITCSAKCGVAIGGRATSMHSAVNHVVFTPPGRASLEMTFEGDQTVNRDISLKAGDEANLSIDEPPVKHLFKDGKRVGNAPGAQPAAAAQTADSDGGLPPYVAIAGGAITLVLASVTTWSAFDTNNAHEAYVAAPTHEGWENGLARQRRTNILIGGTAAAGIGTILVAAFWTRWGGDSGEKRELAVTPNENGGATVTFGGRF